MGGAFHRQHPTRGLRALSVALVLYVWWPSALAETPAAAHACDPPLATVVVARGDVRYKPLREAWRNAPLNQALCAGDEIAVGAASRAALRLGDAISFPLDQQTHLVVRGRDADGKLRVELLSGSINVVTGAAAPIRIVTPHGALETATADFSVSVNREQASLSVFEGSVAVNNPKGSLQLQSDETAFFTEWAAPKRDITLKPRDTVHWIVQYPAILPSGTAGSSAWGDAVRAHEAGRSLDALIALDQVRAEARSAEYHVYRAHVLMLVGRPDEAATSVDAALKADPSLAEAWALRAILDLGGNDAAQAQQHADKAVQLNAASPAANLARSYAYQANRRPADALASAHRMAELAPDSALAYTRIAELELACGDKTAAMRAARRAEQLDPNSADAKSILGFVRLSEGKDSLARTVFESAVQLNSADPRARMGLGLARIRNGQLKAGREDLELAVSLDPENALLRSYLGRAYMEEGRMSEAGEQYARARHLDPNDPTAFSFDAMRLAEMNQPVLAREQMQQALERNENRAVYRGQSLLDEDRAIRQANAVALDRMLGFDDAARAQASAAVAEEPGSGVLHRALGDALAMLPRADPTRRSEYLQATLLSPLGTLPPPLFLSEDVRRGSLAPTSGFFRAVEPGHASYNEFSAVFGATSWRWQAEGILGSHGTLGDQVQLAGTQGNLGWSLSQLKFRADGFTDFDRTDTDAWQGILQADLMPDTRVHLEVNRSDTERQVIEYPAEPFYYYPYEIAETRSRYRIGARQRFGSRHEVLLLGTREAVDQIQDLISTPYNTPGRAIVTQDARAYEAQYRFLGEDLKATMGAIDGRLEASYDDGGGSVTRSRTWAWTAYAYASLRLPHRFNLEMGAARDHQWDDQGFEQRFTSPKIGLQWEPFAGGRLRIARFAGLNRSLTSSASLEPTQVTGFGQFQSERSKALIRTRTRAVGWDQRGPRGSWGVEMNWRKLAEPNFVPVVYSAWSERATRAYATWAFPRSHGGGFPADAEKTLYAVYDAENRARSGTADADGIFEYKPRHLKLGMSIAAAGGLGVNLSATKISASGAYLVYDIMGTTMLQPFSDKFWIADVALTYRLPGKRAQLALGVMNLTDRRGFRYLEPDPLSPRVAPERFLYAKLLLSY